MPRDTSRAVLGFHLEAPRSVAATAGSAHDSAPGRLGAINQCAAWHVRAFLPCNLIQARRTRTWKDVLSWLAECLIASEKGAHRSTLQATKPLQSGIAALSRMRVSPPPSLEECGRPSSQHHSGATLRRAKPMVLGTHFLAKVFPLATARAPSAQQDHHRCHSARRAPDGN
jgi:hypothetical protein